MARRDSYRSDRLRRNMRNAHVPRLLHDGGADVVCVPSPSKMPSR